MKKQFQKFKYRNFKFFFENTYKFWFFKNFSLET